MLREKLQSVTLANPCPHCDKGDWCYRVGNLSVCKRGAPPAAGWQFTNSQDSEGTPYYAPVESTEKPVRPAQQRSWVYCDRNNQPLVRVQRVDYGDGRKPRRWQEHWNGNEWVKSLQGVDRADIPVYRYTEVRAAIANNETIFIAEGEPCADALWDLGVPATTNIGGAGKWKASDTQDLLGAKVVLCPDRDLPGVEHMGVIAEAFPEAEWLYAFPTSPFWTNLPASGGLDVADWIAAYHLTAAAIWEACELRRVALPDPEVPVSPPAIEELYTQKCQMALYSATAWVAINGKLYRWTGTHYQEAHEAEEKSRIGV